MWVYLGMALVAFVSTGCQKLFGEESDSSKKTAPPPPSAKSPPASSSSEAIPQELPPVVPHFGGDWRANLAYIRLLDGADKDQLHDQLDTGCQLSGHTVGAFDRRIEPCEVREYVFGTYPAYVEAMRALTADPIPMGLDDFDNKTPFDDGVRKKLNAAVESLKTSLGIKEVKDASQEQIEKLALGLYHFVHFPDWRERIEVDSVNLRKNTNELEKAGMKDFQDYLFQNGGLGVSLFEKVPGGDPYLSALEALQSKIGSDFSRANILFGAFVFAGLKPKFGIAPSRSVFPDGKPEVHEGYIRMERRYNVLVELDSSEKKQIFFNPYVLDSRRDYKDAKTGDLGKYMGLYMFAKGADELVRTGKFDAGAGILRRSLGITPGDTVAYMALGIAYTKLNNDEPAEFNFRESLRLDPANHLANYHLGNLLHQMGKRKEALPYYLAAVKDSPGWMEPGDGSMIPTVAQEALAVDPKDATALEIQKELKKDREGQNGAAPSQNAITVVW